MHLLFTDPSTAPRTELRPHDLRRAVRAEHSRAVRVLGAAGLPTFYDKLLQVPLLNLSVKSIDWAVRSTPLGTWILHGHGGGWQGGRGIWRTSRFGQSCSC